MRFEPVTAPWHRETFNRFIDEQLPELIHGKLPMEAYYVRWHDNYTCSLEVSLSSHGRIVTAHLTGIPCPGDDGVFHINGEQRIVIPLASSEHLDTAEIKCVGEQLYEYIEPRVGEAPPDLAWTENLLESWLPIAGWVTEFLLELEYPHSGYPGRGQILDTTNWVSRTEHTRRLLVPGRQQVVTESHLGRVCPVQTPEGPNIGKVLAIARGARIVDGKICCGDDSPEATLSVTASMIPFLNHDEPERALMGSNMMRQHTVQSSPEPAYVQTGYEPVEPEFWCGRNLLTAFVSLGKDTLFDGIVISESCARRFNYDGLIEPGDKISNRHGTKGVISRIVPDEQMPKRLNGTPVELVYSFIGCHTRMNFGQLKEAVVGNLAHAGGKSIIVPPFSNLDDEDIKTRLAAAGLPENGQERLTLNGAQLSYPSTVGWVYWGITHHLSRRKVFARPDGYQRQGLMEYYALRNVGAFRVILDLMNTGSAFHDNPESLTQRVIDGVVEPSAPPTPAFKELKKRLSAAGIRMELSDHRISYSFADPVGERLELACAVQHPWMPGRELSMVGAMPAMPEYIALKETNEQMQRVLNGHAPARLKARARKNLQSMVDGYFKELIQPGHLRPGSRSVFSGRAVIAPGGDLPFTQVGLPDAIAWALFGPFAARKLGNSKEVDTRTDRAAAVLDEIMSTKWIIINRAPSVNSTALLAFRPVRIPDKTVRLHPMACGLLNADYDGDQVAVILPVTEAAQQEAGEKLSISGHLNRDPGLVDLLCPGHEALWGLAELSRSPNGRQQIAAVAGREILGELDILDRKSVVSAVRQLLMQFGSEKTLSVLNELWFLGFKAARMSGASMSPFGLRLHVNHALPESMDEDACRAYFDTIKNQYLTVIEPDSHMHVQHQSVVCGARGDFEMLVQGLRGRIIRDISGNRRFIETGIMDGLPPADYFHCAAAARVKLSGVTEHYHALGREIWETEPCRGFTVHSRASQLQCPGVVFAEAAGTGETDPLKNPDTRLFCGLMPLEDLP